ncbi:MAG: PhzF family phenazine biosynthesis protein, partial [Saprospiraceae bacterium]
MKNTLPTYIVDSFTNEPFKGNPAGVCLPESPLSEEQMQAIAKELGFSETAFVTPDNNSDKYAIRFFSPKMEIPLCGHATLASSKILFHENTALEKITFRNIQDLDLHINKEGEKIVMEFPVYETSPAEVPDAMLTALGIESINNSEYNQETNILLLEITDSELLRGLTPDFSALKKSHDSINGVLITAPSKESDYDFESRFFWPWSGTEEDPVTGGTHTFLAKYWSSRLNKTKMNSFQCSARSGFMEVELLSDEKMRIKSFAQIILKGELNIS